MKLLRGCIFLFGGQCQRSSRTISCSAGAMSSIPGQDPPVRDVAIHGGNVAAVAPKIDPALSLKTVEVAGLFVTPGLVDIHVHVFAGTGERRSYAGDNSVYPDGFTLRRE